MVFNTSSTQLALVHETQYRLSKILKNQHLKLKDLNFNGPNLFVYLCQLPLKFNTSLCDPVPLFRLNYYPSDANKKQLIPQTNHISPPPCPFFPKLYTQLQQILTYVMISNAKVQACTPPVHTPVGLSRPQNSTDPTIVHASANREQINIKHITQVPKAMPQVSEQQEAKATTSSRPVNAMRRQASTYSHVFSENEMPQTMVLTHWEPPQAQIRSGIMKARLNTPTMMKSMQKTAPMPTPLLGQSSAAGSMGGAMGGWIQR